MLRALLLAVSAVNAGLAKLSTLFHVLIKHLLCMLCQPINIVIGKHIEDLRDLDSGRTGLTIFTAGTVQLTEFLKLPHRIAELLPFLLREDLIETNKGALYEYCKHLITRKQ